MQQFYTEFQKENESIVSYGSRLEQILTKAIKFGQIDAAAKDSMLRSKFWLGLNSQQLRNATRHKYDSVKDFQLLLREIRQVEQEELNLVKPPQGQGQSQKKSVQQHNISASSESKFNNEELYNQLLE